jgi:hypothetical protein
MLATSATAFPFLLSGWCARASYSFSKASGFEWADGVIAVADQKSAADLGIDDREVWGEVWDRNSKALIS